MRAKFFLNGLLSLVGVVNASSQVYVATKGSDAASGTKMLPVVTISHAVEMARTAKVHEVVLGGGTYRLSSPLIFRADVESGDWREGCAERRLGDWWMEARWKSCLVGGAVAEGCGNAAPDLCGWSERKKNAWARSG
jgi:hypothetical protein